MQRNVHFYFPRVESQIYAEPKRLVAAGLAEATAEMTGKRARTVYAITEAGRAELRGAPSKGESGSALAGDSPTRPSNDLERSTVQ